MNTPVLITVKLILMKDLVKEVQKAVVFPDLTHNPPTEVEVTDVNPLIEHRFFNKRSNTSVIRYFQNT